MYFGLLLFFRCFKQVDRYVFFFLLFLPNYQKKKKILYVNLKCFMSSIFTILKKTVKVSEILVIILMQIYWSPFKVIHMVYMEM